MGIRSKYVPVYHESCINHELKEVVNIEKIGTENSEPAYELHIRCLKGHRLSETNPKCCEDYDMAIEPFGWKLSLMESLIKDLMQGE